MAVIVGTAGWSLPARDVAHFPEEGRALQRYAARFGGVEINSSFHRRHRPATWQRWAESVPASFRFAVKIPKTVTHIGKLVDCETLVEQFLGEAGGLGGKLAILLLQLPPKLAFEAPLAETFLRHLCSYATARVVCEPRHPSWFEAAPDALLDRFEVARVAADPACVPAACLPGGWRGLSYFRLHGSPQMYRSSYDDARLQSYGALIGREQSGGRPVWCMFDNTAASAATGDALALIERLGPGVDRALVDTAMPLEPRHIPPV